MKTKINTLLNSQCQALKTKDINAYLLTFDLTETEKTQLDHELYEKLQWRKDFDPNKDIDLKNDRYVISVDIAEGKDQEEKKGCLKSIPKNLGCSPISPDPSLPNFTTAAHHLSCDNYAGNVLLMTPPENQAQLALKKD